MTDLLYKFSEAVKEVSSDEKTIRECVYCAFVDNKSDINPDDLPEEIQIIYESVKMRLTSVVPPGDIGIDEANYLAKDILFMDDVVRAHYNNPA